MYLANTLKEFKSTGLSETEKVKLMNRVDTKFIINKHDLFPILRELIEEYNILEIDHKRFMKYRSIYFDTSTFNMYLSHQNGKYNRYKIRKREYVDSSISFLEIKFKNNKGRTDKYRVLNFSDLNLIENVEYDFILQKSPFNPIHLQSVLKNHFERITLIHKSAPERVTIDFNLNFSDLKGNKLLFPGLVIIEVKKDKEFQKSPICELLKSKNIPETSFSKYLIGATFLYPKLKSNRLKKNLLKLEKMNIQPLMIKKNEHNYANKLSA